jgi:hypothetical protein
MLADEIQQRVPEPIDRVTEDSSLMVEVRKGSKQLESPFIQDFD